MNQKDFVELFRDLDTSEFPDLYKYEKKLDMILWILLVSKEKLNQKILSAENISQIIINVYEISISPKSIINSLRRASDCVHVYRGKDETVYEIMKPGKDRLYNNTNNIAINTFYFKPGECFTSKKVLSTEIFSNLSGSLKIVDPYSDERTLDVLSNYVDKEIKFLTSLIHLKGRKLEQIERELQDFVKEYNKIDIRIYTSRDLHDRYILSDNKLIILGHSIKDLGKKESFAVRLDKNYNRNIFEAIVENFNRRWKASNSV